MEAHMAADSHICNSSGNATQRKQRGSGKQNFFHHDTPYRSCPDAASRQTGITCEPDGSKERGRKRERKQADSTAGTHTALGEMAT